MKSCPFQNKLLIISVVFFTFNYRKHFDFWRENTMCILIVWKKIREDLFPRKNQVFVIETSIQRSVVLTKTLMTSLHLLESPCIFLLKFKQHAIKKYNQPIFGILTKIESIQFIQIILDFIRTIYYFRYFFVVS